MRRLRALVLAAVGTLTLSACDFNVYDLPLPGGTSTGDDPMTIQVEFTDVLDLVPQSMVQVNDVPVGQVKDVELEGFQALVTIEIRNDVELPDNARAEIRQTSLLGEKFVELEAPEQGARGELEDGETIPIDRAGRNPEVEEVFGALSLILNGGGVAQLKTINVEVAKALEGREGSARSVLRQLRELTGQLDSRKADIVNAIEALDRLARTANQQEDSINAALDELPSAIKSVDRQREDLVAMLKALDQLSDTGVRVIRASKGNTIRTLERLDPVLTQLANAGDDFVNAFSVFLTYPFVDETVGRDPQVARNIKFGDYTNLAIKMDIDLVSLLNDLPGLPNECVRLREVTGPLKNGGLDLQDILGADPEEYCEGVTQAAQRCLGATDPNRKLAACRNLFGNLTKPLRNQICQQPGLNRIPALCNNPNPPGEDGLPLLDGVGDALGGVLGGNGNGSGGNNGGNNSGGNNSGGSDGGGILGGNSPLNRAPFAAGGGADSGGNASGRVSLADMDPDLVRLLVPGVLAR